MNKTALSFTANEQELINNTGEIVIASDVVDYIEATFTLGTNWSGFDVVRAVWKNGRATIAVELDANNKCVVPPEVLKAEGTVRVNLAGSILDDGAVTDRLTTFSVIALQVGQKVKVYGGESQPVSPSQYEQFVNEVKEYAEQAQTAADNSDDSAEDSEAYAIGKRGGTDVGNTDPAYHNNAKYYAKQAEDSAAAAAEVASQEVIEQLRGYAEDAEDSATAAAAADSDSSYQRAQALQAKADAEAAAAAAEESAQAAVNAFQIAGNISASIDPDTRKVTLYFTDAE